MMLKLYGFDVSNFYSMVRMALAAKNLEHECVFAFPNQEPDWLAKSPMGKVPCLETPDGFISETHVILEYLDDVAPETALLPSAPFERARCRQLMHMLEIYVDAPARRLFPGAFFGGVNSEEAVAEVRPILEKAARAIGQLSTMNPYLLGDAPTAADYMALYTLGLADDVTKIVYEWSFLDAIPGAGALLERLNDNDTARGIARDRQAGMEAFLNAQRG